MTELLRKFFDLIAYSACDKPLAEDFSCTEEDIKYFFSLAIKHDIASIVAYALEKNGLFTDGEYSLKFQDEMFFAAGRVTLLDYFYKDVYKCLESADVAFVPLKGAIVRKYYPHDFFRTSGDIDLLVKEEDFDKACKALTDGLKLKVSYRSSHDLALTRSQFETVEIHYSLIEKDRANNAGGELTKAWDNAYPLCGCEYAFTNEFFKFYQVAHMLKHFEESGCGIRFFLDLYFLRAMPVDGEKFKKMLSDHGLLKFYENCEKLVDLWFLGGEEDELIMRMNAFIVYSGLYGNVENFVAIGKKKKGGGFKYVLSRAFLPYDKLKEFFPALEGRKWLLPFYQIKRWFLMIFGGRLKNKVAELKQTRADDGDMGERIDKLFKDLGIE